MGMMSVADSVKKGLGAGSLTWVRGGAWIMLAVLGLFVPRMGLPQAITGPLVNALLILAVEIVGVAPAMVIGALTPLSALTYGVLPLGLLVMAPFIAVGNAALVGIYGGLRRRNGWLAVGVGALVKSAWLWAVVSLLVARPLSVAMGGAAQQVALPSALIGMMQWPQLATALAGGALAQAVLAALRRAPR